MNSETAKLKYYIYVKLYLAMKALAILLLLQFLFFYQLLAVNLPTIIENEIYDSNIKTVEMFRDGWKLSNPIINLNTDEQLVFSFDDINFEKREYYYTIYHCDRDWKISKLAQEEYLKSFVDYAITDYAFSINTNIQYLNYMLKIPNDDIPIIISGNYALVVFDKDNPEKPIITWRFYVVESKISINAKIRRATFDPRNGENQEIDFVINHGSFPINDPISDIKVVISQNNRGDNAITNLKPLFISNGILEYDYNMENTFKGENEFRSFEIRNIKYPGEGVEDIRFIKPLYHVTLETSYGRVQKPYNYYKEMNGNYYIEAFNKDYPEVEADYMFVHFTLPLAQPLLGGGIYVFGKLSNWQCSKFNEMKYNMELNQYEGTLLLKQGYYNFTYAYKDYSSNEVKCYNIEGSHYETENDYQIYVYYGMYTDRYDRLIGYQKFNSLSNRSY